MSATPNSPLGAVGQLDDGRHYVVFERQFPYPIETVWDAVTDPDELAKWFPGFKLPREVGGRFQIWFSDTCEGPAHVTGEVTAFKPPNLLVCGTMRFELSTTGDNSCQLKFSDILMFDERNRTDFTNAVLGGWHSFMDLLTDALAGRPVDINQAEPVDYTKVDVPGRP